MDKQRTAPGGKKNQTDRGQEEMERKQEGRRDGGVLDVPRSNDNYWHLPINILAQAKALFLH